MSLSPRLLLQYILPQHTISRLVHRCTRSARMPLRRSITRWFVRRFGVDMSEAAQPDLDAYPNFNRFFTRALRPGARTITTDPRALACPVDGYVSQKGTILGGEIFQAKGHRYSVGQLLGGKDELAAPFRGGAFATLYLSPGDYHRIHMPLDGRLQEMVHIPGRLFSVAPACVQGIPGLFARNERVVCLFDTAHGPLALVLVGAINVGSIETVWAGEVTPPRGKRIAVNRYPGAGAAAVELAKGDEMGRFNMGSTVIILLGPNHVRWHDDLTEGARVRLGQAIGRLGA